MTRREIVAGFLTAADSFPLYGVAEEYLTSSAVKLWNPGFAVTVFSKMNGPNVAPTPTASPSGGQRAKVEVTGTVQAMFNGTGQYVSALSPGPASTDYNFDLVKVNGQWRIDNPPNYRMLLVGDFPFFYKAQDLYFMDPGTRCSSRTRSSCRWAPRSRSCSPTWWTRSRRAPRRPG